ncbi:DUF6515 family protein [Mucilaginibacter sp.]
MKTTIKSLSYAFVTAMVSLCLSLPATAQHNNNGGGGGSRPAASSAPHSSPSFTPRASYSGGAQRSNNNSYQHNNNFNRQNTPPRTTGITQQRTNNNYNNGAHTSAGFTRTQTGAAVQTSRSYNGSGSYYGHNHTGGFSGGVSVHAGFTAHGNNYYHYNHGYYASYYAPRLGFSIGVLPYGYYPFYYGDYQYFYSGGLFYQYDNDQYTVVEPPVGAEVKTLPSDAQSIVINGQQYYEADGIYYIPITKDDGTLSYQVAGKDGELNTADASADNAPPAPQIGDVVAQLPPNCRKITVNGSRLYLSPDGIYYKPQVDANGNTSYIIVGLPADNDQDQPDQTTN